MSGDGTFLPKGATPWSAYNTPRIWAMVENEDDPESWRQVAALGSMAGLLKDQRSRLEVAKQKLIDAWPPEQNKASAAFLQLMDNLLLTMDKNKMTADTNAAALSHVLEALRQAKADIAPLYQTYLEKNDDWVPGWWDSAEDELDEQARKRMREAEAIIAHPDNTIQAPDPYEFAPGEYVSKPIGVGADGGGSGTASVPSASGIGASGGFQVPHDPPPTLPSNGSPLPSPSLPQSPFETSPGASGPELAGVIAPTPGPTSIVTPVAPPAPSGLPVSQLSPGLVIGGGSIPPNVSGPGAQGGRGGAAPFGISQPGRGLGGPGGGRGGLPPTKPATPPWLPLAPGQSPRGGAGAGARSGSPSIMPAAGGRRPAEGHDDTMTFDPDRPWATAEGVTPVIEPSRKQYRHDPGPGVIGWRT